MKPARHIPGFGKGGTGVLPKRTAKEEQLLQQKTQDAKKAAQ